MKTLLFLALAGLPGPPAPPHSPHQGRPQSRARAKAPARPAVRAKAPATGLKADSLDGIPGHRFGESRSNFPELEARGFNDPLTGLVSYSLRDGQQGPGWFAKNTDQVSSTYWFYHDQFAALTTHARNRGRQLLADEATYLFGEGQPQGTAFGQTTYQWHGQRVLVELTDGHNETSLSISSCPIQARQAADQQAKQKAEAAARATKFKADNAPSVR